MNRFEYFSDEYVGFTVEHNFEKKLINLLPIIRKTNIRQFWNLKAVWGDLSGANKKLNFQDYGNYRMQSFQGKSYIELGTGFDNVFKYFRVDLVWRFAPSPNSNPGMRPVLRQEKASQFGIFGSFHVQF